MHVIRKALSVLMSVVLCVGLCPAIAFASDDREFIAAAFSDGYQPNRSADTIGANSQSAREGDREDQHDAFDSNVGLSIMSTEDWNEDEVQLITGRDGKEYRCAKITTAGADFWSPMGNDLANGGMYVDDRWQSWYNLEVGCQLSFSSGDSTSNALMVSCADSSGIVARLQTTELSDENGNWSEQIQIQPESGPISVFADYPVLDSVSYGVMKFEGSAHPNASMLFMDLPDGVVFNGMQQGVGDERNVATIRQNHSSYTNLGIYARSDGSPEYYFWPDQENEFSITVEGGAEIDPSAASLVPLYSASSNPGTVRMWRVDDTNTYGVAVELNVPAVLRLDSNKPDLVTPIADAQIGFVDAVYAMGSINDVFYAVGSTPELSLVDLKTGARLTDADYEALLQRLDGDGSWIICSEANEQGEYRYLITGKGSYFGTTQRTFNVVPSNSLHLAQGGILNNKVYLASDVPYACDFMVSMPNVEQPLRQGIDFDLTYEYTGDYPWIEGVPVEGLTRSGWYKVTAVGKGSYQGFMQSVVPVVDPGDAIDISNFEIEDFSDRISVNESEPFWKYGVRMYGQGAYGETISLYENDVDVEYRDSNGTLLEEPPNTVGSYTVIVRAKDDQFQYEGSIEKTFSIVDAIPISCVSCTIYGGAYVEGAVPALELRDESDDTESDDTVLTSADYEAELQRWDEGLDDYVACSSADSVGKYRYLITGIGAYAGTIQAWFSIVAPNSLELAHVITEEQQPSSDVPYRPQIEVWFGGHDEDKGTLLVEDKDYLVSYVFEGEDGDETVEGLSTPGDYRIEITGMGAYQDAISAYVSVVQYDEIQATDISQLESAHPYINNTHATWTYSDATAIGGFLVTFSEDTFTEEECDTITIFDGAGKKIGDYTGDELAGKTVYVKDSTSFSILLESDGTETSYGFKVIDVVPLTKEKLAEYEARDIRIISDSSGFAHRCAKIEEDLTVGVEIYPFRSGLDQGDTYWDGEEQAYWYDIEQGCELHAYPKNAAYKVSSISYTANGELIVPELVKKVDEYGHTRDVFAIPANSGRVVVTAVAEPASTVKDGVMTFEDESLPNAYLLQFDLPEGVTLNGRVFGGSAGRETVLITPDDPRYSGRGVESYYEGLNEYYIWPDSETSLMFDLPEGYQLASWDLVSNSSDDPGEVTQPLGFSGLVISLRAPATLKLGMMEVVGDLANAQVHVADQVYTGAELKPPVRVTFDGKELVEGVDYVVLEYENNTEVGTASVRVGGIKAYTGVGTGTFKITHAEESESGGSGGSGTNTAGGASAATGAGTTGAAAPPAPSSQEQSASSASDLGVAVGKNVKTGGSTFKVTSNGSGSKATARFAKAAKSKKSVKVPATVKASGKTYQVTGIAKGAFKGSKAKTVTVKSKKLTKKSVKNCFKGSKVEVVKVPKSKLKAYQGYFSEKNSGRAVKVVGV